MSCMDTGVMQNLQLCLCVLNPLMKPIPFEAAWLNAIEIGERHKTVATLSKCHYYLQITPELILGAIKS